MFSRLTGLYNKYETMLAKIKFWQDKLVRIIAIVKEKPVNKVRSI